VLSLCTGWNCRSVGIYELEDGFIDRAPRRRYTLRGWHQVCGLENIQIKDHRGQQGVQGGKVVDTTRPLKLDRYGKDQGTFLHFACSLTTLHRAPVDTAHCCSVCRNSRICPSPRYRWPMHWVATSVIHTPPYDTSGHPWVRDIERLCSSS